MDRENELVSVNREVTAPDMAALCLNSVSLVRFARRIAARQINLVQLMTFYALGRWIVEVQQQGERRAAYGQKVMAGLSKAFSDEFGRGLLC